MDWDDLRYFLVLCREGSVSGAGQALGVSHTTVARRVEALEQALNTRLFDRSVNGYQMTQAAEDIYGHAQAMEERAQAIDRNLFGQDAELKGPLKLTVSHDLADRLLMPYLVEFRERYPCIDLELLTTTGLMDLAAREADLAVRLTSKPPEFLVGREVLPLRHGVYGAPEYLQGLDGPPEVVLFRGNRDLPPWVVENFPEARVAMRIDDVTAMLTAVRNGMGLARMPCYIGDTDNHVLRLDLPLTNSDWGVWILNHADLRSTARVRLLREYLIHTIERQRSLVLGENSRYFEASG